jgi:pimeloyl-ACP methyl ester carboxylesterase
MRSKQGATAAARAGLAAGAALALAACATTETAWTMFGATDMRDGPGGEAGPIALRDQGFFWVGARTATADGALGPATTVSGQMYVGYQLVAEPQHPYPLVLVHGGGGQATDWMGTPDGRDGWLDYFLAAGFDVYFVDRPAHGRSPNNAAYGERRAPPTTEGIANLIGVASTQYPGTVAFDDPMVIAHTASSEPGPTVSNVILKENFAELLDRVGPAILVTHSAGGVSGWLALDARPELVKGVLAIEAASGVTGDLAPLMSWEPALGAGEPIVTAELASEAEGRTPCRLQPEGSVRTLPAFAGKPVLGVVAEVSQFAAYYHCTVAELRQVGADATLVRLEDEGIHGNGHFMNEELNNAAIARLFIAWLETVE